MMYCDDVYCYHNKEAEAELTAILSKEINDEINRTIIKSLKMPHVIINDNEYEDTTELDKAFLKPKKNKKIKKNNPNRYKVCDLPNGTMYKTPDDPSVPQYIYGKFVPIEEVPLIGNIGNAGKLKTKTKYVSFDGINGFGKIISNNNMFGL